MQALKDCWEVWAEGEGDYARCCEGEVEDLEAEFWWEVGEE